MNPKHITSQSLRHLLTLTEKKEQFLKGLEDIETEIAKALKGAATSVVAAAEAVTPFKPTKAKKKSRKGKAGGLKERILALLQDAGDQGLKVKEIAEKLGAKAGNVSVWFSTTGKKLTTKVEPGRYAVKGSKPVVVTAASVATPAKVTPKKKTVKKVSKTTPVTSVAKAPTATKKAKPVKMKSGLTPEGRAKLAASMKARWAAKKAGKPAGKAAKKGFKLPKAGKNPF